MKKKNLHKIQKIIWRTCAKQMFMSFRRIFLFVCFIAIDKDKDAEVRSLWSCGQSYALLHLLFLRSFGFLLKNEYAT
jgi:hypothetical protein